MTKDTETLIDPKTDVDEAQPGQEIAVSGPQSKAVTTPKGAPAGRANDNGQEWYASIPRSGKWPTIGGILVLLMTFGGFGVWASTAPVAGAVISSGTFVANGQNKIIQHLEGGIIREILVKEGDIVEEGQPLIKLDETAAKANLRRLILRKVRLLVTAARLKSEADHHEAIELPATISDQAKEADVRRIIISQAFAFDTRKRNLQSEIDVLERGIDALKARIEGAEAQHEAVIDQQVAFTEEVKVKKGLLRKGHVSKTEVLRLQRAQANLRGEEGRLLSDIDDSKQRIERARAQITQLRNQASQNAVDELHRIQAELDDVREQISAATDVLERVDIIAPVRGVVVRLQYHTPGGVIEGGRNVMEILPILDDLIIQSQILPKDIDNVQIGQEAAVRLPGLNQRTTPILNGQVIYVSADVLPNEQRSAQAQIGSDIYVARIKLDAREIGAIDSFRPTPGMPAEVYIRTRDRTFFDYLVEPIRDSFNRAFRET
ncbi:MAG: HlyD family type I secretion periplasmic adaptor subunit [Pseudomonadota bacterium]